MDEEKKIKSIISNTLGISVKDLTLNADLKQDLNTQDLEISDLLMKLEKEFRTQLSAHEIKSINTVGDIINLFTQT